MLVLSCSTARHAGAGGRQARLGSAGEHSRQFNSNNMAPGQAQAGPCLCSLSLVLHGRGVSCPDPNPLMLPFLLRLDSLVGLFAAKCAPTATADPYGLRRSAVGMLQVGAGC